MQKKDNIGLYTGTKISSVLKNSIFTAVESGIYLNASSFVREAIKEKLVREGYLRVEKEKGPNSI
jgi:Arc/MetJ-type ribon-helix-helix transcriptional regulator